MPGAPESRGAEPHPAGAVRESEELAANLRSALARHDITLPSLRPGFPIGSAPLIDLGRCNRETTLRLTMILNALADDRQSPA
ncbi:hypothetical protein ABH940_004273 [Streptacidiphilus sp. BW17]